MKITRRKFLAAAAAAPLLGGAKQLKGRRAYFVPNFHPASCGWLTNFSKERVYCANSYFDHLDRVSADPQYGFVLSEVNNLIAMMNFRPERREELKRGIKSGQVELVNGFFLESTINLSGGEALVRLGVEGLRWQKAMFGVTPRFAWTIDVCGTHDQMAQITAGLGLEAMVYTRKNPTGSAVHWTISPDGSRVLTISPGHYSELGSLMTATEPLNATLTAEVEKHLESKMAVTPEGAPVLVLLGSGDYALAPARKEFPREFLEDWKKEADHPEIRFSVMGKYLDELQAMDRGGKLAVPTLRGGTEYDFNSFWIESPRVKSSYRRCEHHLQATEALATVASLSAKHVYPAQELYNAWTLMFLNMDRNTLWGSAGGMVFEHETSWDVTDRFEWVTKHTRNAAEEACASLLPTGEGLGLFNPLNWERRDPVVLTQAVEGVAGQEVEGGVLCSPALASVSVTGFAKAAARAATAREVRLPGVIRTKHYEVKIDPANGAIISAKVHGKEMLAGPANVLVAEKPKSQHGDPGDFMLPRPERERLYSSSEHTQKIRAMEGLLATVVEVEGEFLGGGMAKRRMVFHKEYPRIDFSTELNDLPNLTVTVAEFPLAGEVTEVRRGIPYGFSHGAWAKPNAKLHGWTKGIVPAVRWSHYELSGGGGAALLDRGLSGRELNGNTPILYLYNATDKYYGYPNAWLSGKGRHILEYALVLHDGDWTGAHIPQMAWEYNCPPLLAENHGAQAAKSFLSTSDNVIVEAVRRVGGDIEVRLVECKGYAGMADVTLALPHRSAALTDLNGAHAKTITGGPKYSFPVRPQQIVTLRFRTKEPAVETKLVTDWEEMVPAAKLPMLRAYSSEKGHPPKGN